MKNGLYSPPVDPVGQEHAGILEDLLHDDQQDHSHDHDISLIAVVTVADRDVTESSAAHGACHGAVAQDGAKADGHADDQGYSGFDQENLCDDRKGVRS